MTIPPPDGSRDRRIEDPSNLLLIHPLGRMMLPWAVRRGISANAVSVTGLLIGAGAAIAFSHFAIRPFALLGLVLAIGWLVADGLDGMVARATGTSSPLGRVLDGVCDHGVFILIYVAMAARIATIEAWLLAIAAGIAHGLQSSLYEGERARFHRRAKGIAQVAATITGGRVVRSYDRIAGLPDRLARAFERKLASAADPGALGAVYADRATPPMKLLSLETANVRVLAIFVACLIGDPRIFWWFEIGPLTLVAIAGLVWHRRIERRLLQFSPHNQSSPAEPARFFVKEQGQ